MRRRIHTWASLIVIAFLIVFTWPDSTTSDHSVSTSASTDDSLLGHFLEKETSDAPFRVRVRERDRPPLIPEHKWSDRIKEQSLVFKEKTKLREDLVRSGLGPNHPSVKMVEEVLLPLGEELKLATGSPRFNVPVHVNIVSPVRNTSPLKVERQSLAEVQKSFAFSQTVGLGPNHPTMKALRRELDQLQDPVEVSPSRTLLPR